jgi:glycosyltransferase involved in cell wall biosynthesis
LQLKILQIHTRYLFQGGEDASVDRVLPALSADHRVDRCLFSSSMWKQPEAPPLWRQPFLMWRNPKALERIREAHETFRPNLWLVHNVYPVASAGVYGLARQLGVPVVYFGHNFRPFSVNGYCWAGQRLAPEGLRGNYWPEILAGSWQNSRIKTAIFATVLRKLRSSGWLESIKAWVAISDFMRDRFIEAGVPADRVFTLRHSWDLLNENSSASEDNGFFLYLGRLSTEKGIPVLLEAWQKLRASPGFPDKARLVIAGEGPLQTLVEKASATDPTIRFEGYVSGNRKADLLRSCRAVVVPSVWWEALGLVVYEAYDFSKPVLAARSGGLTETVTHHQTGLLHEPGHADELARHLSEITNNPAKAQAWGRAGRAWLEKNTSTRDWLARFNTIADYAIRNPP